MASQPAPVRATGGTSLGAGTRAWGPGLMKSDFPRPSGDLSFGLMVVEFENMNDVTVTCFEYFGATSACSTITKRMLDRSMPEVVAANSDGRDLVRTS